MLEIDPFPYQDEAIDLILDLGYGLVAYEMGLGKTVIGIAVAEELLGDGDVTTVLLVVPANLKWQWAQSLAKFTDMPTINKKVKGREYTIPSPSFCVVIDGTKKQRAKLYEQIEFGSAEYIICSYEQVVNDYEMIANIGAELIVLDEASLIKSFQSLRSQAVKSLVSEYRVALTGTAVENRPEEVFSIMEFVEPSWLGSPKSFDRKFIDRDRWGGVKRYKNLDILSKKMRKVMSRKTRLDPDVAPFMPAVDQKTEWVFLDRKGQALYDHVAKMLLEDLEQMTVTQEFDLDAHYGYIDNGKDMSGAGRVMAKMMVLQMLCDHPKLIYTSAEKYAKDDGGSKFAYDVVSAGLLDGVEKTPKLDAVEDDVRDILDGNEKNKVIIFSFYKEMGRLIQDRFKDDYGTVLYNGDMNSDEKQAAKLQFQEDPEVRLLIASDAGGYGLDLPQANYLINYDLAESAGKMDQRNARHVRAGSDHDKVFIVNYVIDGSIEERLLNRLNFKRRVSRAIIDDDHNGSELGVIENDVASLREWLS